MPFLSMEPVDLASPVADQGAQGREFAAVRAKFIADFAEGTVGQHHNTYQHRARVLRGLIGKPEQ